MSELIEKYSELEKKYQTILTETNLNNTFIKSSGILILIIIIIILNMMIMIPKILKINLNII